MNSPDGGRATTTPLTSVYEGREERTDGPKRQVDGGPTGRPTGCPGSVSGTSLDLSNRNG